MAISPHPPESELRTSHGVENLGILCGLQIWLQQPPPPHLHTHPFQYNNLERLMENLKDICVSIMIWLQPTPPPSPNPELELLIDDLEFLDMTTTEYSPRIQSCSISLGLVQYECTTTHSNSPFSILFSCRETHYSLTVLQCTN